ncbi:hypothetical protein, partial [Streptomyces sp. F001]|uniref:hypothetical protein n=1 Tax=Streptomyces sp. F001 TaxID=1510026 RepID=UPI0019D29A67
MQLHVAGRGAPLDRPRRCKRSQRHEIRDPLFNDCGGLGAFALGDIGARIIELLDDDQTDASAAALDDGFHGRFPACSPFSRLSPFRV